MDMSLSEGREYVHGELNRALIINQKSPFLAERRLALQDTDPVAFNRICGPLIAATADPTDRLFSMEIGVSAEMVSISATFSRQIRHIAALQDKGSSDLIMLFTRSGTASLQVGSVKQPLEVALIGADVDFTIRAMKPGDACTVGCVALRSVPDLIAQMPQSLITPFQLAGGNAGEQLNMLRECGERIVTWTPRDGGRSPDAVQLAQLILDRYAAGPWPGGTATDTPGNPAGRDIVAAVQRYLRQHASDAELTPARLARHCAVSVRKLYNAFAAADMSLRATVLSYRLEEARRQLHSRTVKKVTSIAYDAGFRDVSTFYRNFRREFGYPPRHTGDPTTSEADVPENGASPVDETQSGGTCASHVAIRRTIAPNLSITENEQEQQRILLESASQEKASPVWRDPTEAIRLPVYQESSADNIQVPRNTLFRHHACRSRKLIQTTIQDRRRRP